MNLSLKAAVVVGEEEGEEEITDYGKKPVMRLWLFVAIAI